MSNRFTVAQAADYLKVSEAFVQTMVAKGRLVADADGLYEQQQLDALATLIEKLKGEGIAAMVATVEQQL
ncbi:helix-turn-helix domain-containing protein [Gilvimarinus chinensis]|uniref:helix-turn-helix domain-containing protein n=1 Tax=Gilvimarinus chinensis TaxID=396005 RepID=UPI000382F22A|nr:helix-turn-helix domain-containing protein [Gilvimarinus chinensis]